jgi:predicted transposase YbfD/YdcC
MPTVTVSPTGSVPEALDHHDLTAIATIPDTGLIRVLESVPDPRDRRGLRYPMPVLLAIAILATAAGMRGFAGYATWAREAPADLLGRLGLTRRYRPSEKTFRRVLGLLDATDLDHRLSGFFTTAALTATDGPLVAVALDGKTLRLAKRMGAAGAHLISACAHHTRLVIGQLAVDDRTNEIPTVKTLLKNLRGAVKVAGTGVKLMITIDAMHTQTGTARLIRRYLGWHYLMIAKDNQPGLLKRLTRLPWNAVPIVATDSDTAPRHGRVEHRTLQVIATGADIDFPYARQAIRIIRDRLVVATGERSSETVYALCTAPFELAKPQQIAAWLRQHWTIENSVHYVRDVTFDEDRSSVRTGTTHQIMATIRNTVINLHRLHGADNIAEACRTTAFNIDTSDYLLQTPRSSH